MEKSAGIFLPLFSAPGNQGIGDLGQKSLMVIDEIAKAGYSTWAMLPLTVTQKDNDPASAASAFAGDPIYINIDRLAEMGLLTQSSITNCNKFKNYIDYDHVRSFKEDYFRKAFKSFRKQYSKFKADFEAFKKEAKWLNQWTAYQLFRNKHEGKGWSEWPPEYQEWPEKQQVNLREYAEQIFYIQFLQFIFYKQLDEVSAYARKKGVHLMVDVPFYLNLDSAEVWGTKREFMVGHDATIKQSAGLPADADHPQGQNWQKPIYELTVMKDDQYRNFRRRVNWAARNFDTIRLVYFRGLDSFWKIPEGKLSTAGKWVGGPGKDLLKYLVEDNPSTNFIAEDRDMQKPSMRELQRMYGIPGMDTIGSRLETKLLKKPVTAGTVAYTTTEDMPTLESIYNGFTNNKKIALRRFFKKRGYDHRPFHELVCHYAIDSDTEMVLLSLPDVCGYKGERNFHSDDEAVEGDWNWKLKDFKTFPRDLQKTTQWLREAQRLPEGFDKPKEQE